MKQAKPAAQPTGTAPAVVIGMDPHKRSATIEVLNRSEDVLGEGRFASDTAGYRAMLAAGRTFPSRLWAVEGANGIGKHLAQRLIADGEDVVDVPAKLSARARVFSTGQGRKTDATDAHSIAVVALRTTTLRAVTVDGEHVALRLLADRRDELGVRRTETVNRIHKLLLELMPGGAKKFLSAAQAKALVAPVRPRDVAGKTRRRIVVALIDELAATDKLIKAANKELTELVTASGSRLMDLQGIGPSTAARLLGDVGDIARFPSKGHFASWNGTAPIDASSGDSDHQRLSRAGNRRLNRVLHTMAIVQLRHDTEGRRYFDGKKAAGKSSMEALRALKRRLSDVVYRQMVADQDVRRFGLEPPDGPSPEPAATALAQEAELVVDLVEALDEKASPEALVTGPGGQVGAATGSSAVDCNPGVDASEKSLPGPARPSSTRARRPRKTRP
ncbi:IS110 family transposase [Kineococcus aurantiacus]|uniref:Transposase n=1 Tax=Kineococcus aurantiacus TaxID=37633 RepID=A0A7Y9DR73_9ACTN|nr:IS110 family transposase [Kineococcus aurantiacus]NYD24976.1 transposase [Kineococcus aurantiacus]